MTNCVSGSRSRAWTRWMLAQLLCAPAFASAQSDIPTPLQSSDFTIDLQRVDITGQRFNDYLNQGISFDPFDIPGLNVTLPTSFTIDTKDKEAQANASSPDCGRQPQGPHPVILKTGEKNTTETDFASVGMYGLSFTRVYRSTNAISGMMGVGWKSEFDWNMNTTGSGGCFSSGGTCYPRLVNVFFPDGSHYTYVLDTGRLVYTAGNADRLGEITFQLAGAERWTLTSGSGIYGFDNNGGLLRRVTPNGSVTTTLTGASGGILVSNNAGQSMLLSLVGGKIHTITDPDNKVWTYDYNANGNLAKVTSPGGHTRIYGYDPVQKNALTSITVDGVQTLAVSYYSDNGRVKTSGTPDGEYVDSYTYGSNTTTLSNQAGDVQTYTFGSFGSLGVNHAGTTSCASALSSIVYDSLGYIDYTVDFNGYKTDYTYDSTGLLKDWTVQAGSANARKTTVSWWMYGVSSKPVKYTYYGTSGTAYKSTTYDYYGNAGPIFGLMKSRTDKDEVGGALVAKTDYAYTFDSSNHMRTRVETRELPTGSVSTTYAFDSSGNLTSYTDAAGNVTAYANYNGLGHPGTITWPGGAVESVVYDEYGSTVSDTIASSSGTGTSHYAYDGDSHLISYTLAKGETAVLHYTPGGRLATIADSAGKSTTYTHVASSNVFGRSSERDAVTWSGSTPNVSVAGSFNASWQLDSRDRLWKESGNSGQLTTYTNDKQGNIIGQTDGISTTTMTPDGEGRNTSQTNPDAGQILYSWADDGNLATMRSPRGLLFQFKRNGLGGLKEIDNPDFGNSTYVSDAFGRYQSEARSNGTSIVYSWDGLDRPVSRTSNGATETYRYDEGNGKGELSSFSNASGSRTYGFDTAGRITSQTDTIFGQTYQQTRQYNGAGLLIAQTYPSGLRLAFGYSADGRVTSISSNVPATPTIVSSVLYQPSGGAIYGWLYGNGSGKSLQFDADGRLAGMTTTGVQNASFTYLNDDSLLTQTDSLQPEVNSTYGYDSSKRLTSVSRSGDAQSLTWDTDWNRTSLTRAGASSTYGYPAGSNQLNSVGGVGVAYMTGGGDFYAWGAKDYSRDEFDRLAAFYMNGTLTGQYRYNTLNQRVYKSTASGITNYVYDSKGRLISEITGGAETDYVWLRNQLVALYRGGQIFFVNTDFTGRPQAVTNAANTVVWKAKNAPFDSTVQVDTIGGLNIRFPGQYYDAESAMYYNGRRYYEPSLGRYIESDPAGLLGGLNTYTYANGNPLSNADPSGMNGIKISLFAGTGAEIAIGRNPNGSGFMTLQFGYGIGGGAEWDPNMTSPGYQECQCGAWTLAYGLYADFKAQVGPVKGGAGVSVGRTVNACGSAQYGGPKGKLSLKDGLGMKLSASAGGQLSLAGGGSAAEECTCGN